MDTDIFAIYLRKSRKDLENQDYDVLKRHRKILLDFAKSKRITIHEEDIYEEVGTPLDTYIGYEADSTLCVLSGLSLPYTKMDEIREKIDASKDTIKRNITAQNNSRLTNNLGFFDEVSEKPKEKKKSNRDMLF